MFDARTNLSAQVVAEVREHFGAHVYQTVIPRSVRLSEAPSFGKCILEHESNGIGARAYRTLAEEFLRRGERAGVISS
jgi:chromosome partitioning protein